VTSRSVRAFVALELPGSIRADLATLIARAQPGAPGKLAWVPEEKLHLTLAFLGACPPQVLDRRALRLPESLRTVAALELPLSSPWHCLGSARPPVLCVAVPGRPSPPARLL